MKRQRLKKRDKAKLNATVMCWFRLNSPSCEILGESRDVRKTLVFSFL